MSTVFPWSESITANWTNLRGAGHPEKFSRLYFISEMEPEGPEKFSCLHFISEIPPPPRHRRIAAPTKPGLVPLMARAAGLAVDRYPALKQLVSAGTGPVAR
jgi:hypothetical protein